MKKSFSLALWLLIIIPLSAQNNKNENSSVQFAIITEKISAILSRIEKLEAEIKDLRVVYEKNIVYDQSIKSIDEKIDTYTKFVSIIISIITIALTYGGWKFIEINVDKQISKMANKIIAERFNPKNVEAIISKNSEGSIKKMLLEFEQRAKQVLEQIEIEHQKLQAITTSMSLALPHARSSTENNEFSNLYKLAATAFDNKDYLRARVLIEEALKLDPKSVSAKIYLGLTFAETEDFESAIKIYDAIINDSSSELSPDYSIALNNKGVALEKLGKTEEAIEMYKQAALRNASTPNYWNNLGNAYRKVKKFKEAIDSYQRSHKLNPTDFGPINDIGIIYEELQDLEKAIEMYNKAISGQPNLPYPYYNLARLYAFKGEKSEMIKFLQKAIELNPEFKKSAKEGTNFQPYWNDSDFVKITS